MTIPSRVLKLSYKKQILLLNRLQSDITLFGNDDLRAKKAAKHTGQVQLGTKRLVAYVVLNRNDKIETGLEVSELQDFLRNRLPDYMMPSSFTFLEKLPRNSNGKVNYQALPNPAPVSAGLKAHLDFPTTCTEKELQNIWSLALGIDHIGIHDNFFNLGGHSLLVARIVSKIRKTFGVNVPMRALFEYPTLATLGQTIDTLVWTKNEYAPKPSPLQSDREEFEI